MDIWPEPDMFGMTEADQKDYLKKKHALTMYSEGVPLTEIAEKTQISRQYLLYLMNRCSQIDLRGKEVGYFGLLKGKHVRKHLVNSENLDSGKALPGSFQALLEKYPELEKVMRKAIVDKILPDSKKANPRLTWYHLHDTFLNQCTELGIPPTGYPFCSDSKGKKALIAWGGKLLSLVTLGTTEEQYFPEEKLPPTSCYKRVEIDGHYIDVNWKIEVPGLNGEGIINVSVSRLWLIALIEVKSSAVLGYSISLSKNYNAADVALAVRNSLVPWTPRNLSISTIAYKPGECLPNALIPELSYLCYEELWLDNAKSHLSNSFLTMLERNVNCVPVFGPSGSPNVRPHIEGLFDLLEEAGIHCLEGTTGSHAKDPRRTKNPKPQNMIALETLLDLMDLLIVRYNTGICPGTTISRNDVLKRAVQRETSLFRYLTKNKREKCIKYSIFDEAIIGQERGKPILRWQNARYDGSGLHVLPNLIGQKVLIMADVDVREIEVVLLSDGTSLGRLVVEKRWRGQAHSLGTRATIRRYMTNHSFLSHASDIPLAFTKHMHEKAKESSTNQRILAKLHSDKANASKSNTYTEDEYSFTSDEMDDSESIDHLIDSMPSGESEDKDTEGKSEFDRLLKEAHSSFR